MRIGVSHFDPIPPENASYCFYWSTGFSLQDFPSLSIVEIGCGGFHNANICLLESRVMKDFFTVELPCLLSFTAGSSSFGGVCDGRSKQVARFCGRQSISLCYVDVPQMTLVTFGSKAFYYFHELIVSGNLQFI